MSDIESTENGLSWIITYDEDTWMGLPQGCKDYCQRQWTLKAVERGKRIVALRLIPDALFPQHGREKPYIAWSLELDPKQKNKTDRVSFAELKDIYSQYEQGKVNDTLLIAIVARYVQSAS